MNFIINISIQESARLQQEPVPGITAAPDENNARYFKVVIDGPSEVLISFMKWFENLRILFNLESI